MIVCMSIVISIVKLPESAVDTKSTHTFAHQGGTIGRSSDNEWVLEDPERFISSQHSKISFENGQYYLTDLSTNGTFQNGSAEPIGKGNTIKLNDGDKFALGDYEFLTSVWQPEEQSPHLSQGPFADTAAVGSFPAGLPNIEFGIAGVLVQFTAGFPSFDRGLNVEAIDVVDAAFSVGDSDYFEPSLVG